MLMVPSEARQSASFARVSVAKGVALRHLLVNAVSKRRFGLYLLRLDKYPYSCSYACNITVLKLQVDISRLICVVQKLVSRTTAIGT